jgi:hypothetical protein
MPVIFFGDVAEYLADLALAQDPHATLLDQSNYKQFLLDELAQTAVFYTALGDLPKDLEVVFQILCRADRVIYCPPECWSDGKTVDCIDPSSSIQGLSEIMLSLLPADIEIENFNPIMLDPMPLVDTRRGPERQIWIAGCSISHGVGVLESERYGELLAQNLAMPCSFLTRVAAALDWAAGQILRSDIRADDLVVWGMTSPERMTYMHDHRLLIGVTPRTFSNFEEYKDIVDPANLYCHDTLYKNYYSVLQVINYCDKINANLFLLSLLHGSHLIQRAFRQHHHYVHVPYQLTYENRILETKYLDIAPDGEHPGPAQHHQYFQAIIRHITQNPQLKKLYVN